MALTDTQKQKLEELLHVEAASRKAAGGTPLVDYALATDAQRRNFLVGIVRPLRVEKDGQLARRAADQAAETARITAERDALQALEDNL